MAVMLMSGNNRGKTLGQEPALANGTMHDPVAHSKHASRLHQEGKSFLEEIMMEKSCCVRVSDAVSITTEKRSNNKNSSLCNKEY